MSCKHDSSLTDQPILMKLYTAAVFDLRMCIMEYGGNTKYCIPRRISSSAGWDRYPFVIWLTVPVNLWCG